MSAELTYSSIRLAHHAREQEEKRNTERKRHILSIIMQYLRDEGCLESARLVAKESGVGEQYEVCDNIDLPSIVKEYEAYYFVRFQKYPKLCKKVESARDNTNKTHVRRKNPIRKIPQNTAPEVGDVLESADLDLTIQALPIGQGQCPPANVSRMSDSGELPAERLLRPLAGLSFDGESRQFAEIISRDIYMQNPNVRWGDIKGLEEPKRLLKEAVVYPTKYPDLFSGILAPWRGLLLYGPSGTGKTLLAKAVATECGTTFFNVSASTLVSKWRGESEKLVRVLFELARYHAPSTVFVDEVDALAGKRGCLGEHEASRRLQAELLVQLDGLNDHAGDRNAMVFLLVTSNLPWELDPALLRRLEKRILVDLPGTEAREQILRHLLPAKTTIANVPPALTCHLDYRALAQESEGYSGADIRLVCKEAAMQAVRGVFDELESSAGADFSRLRLEVVTTEAVREALSRTKPCASTNVAKFRAWQEQFGAL